MEQHFSKRVFEVEDLPGRAEMHRNPKDPEVGQGKAGPHAQVDIIAPGAINERMSGEDHFVRQAEHELLNLLARLPLNRRRLLCSSEDSFECLSVGNAARKCKPPILAKGHLKRRGPSLLGFEELEP